MSSLNLFSIGAPHEPMSPCLASGQPLRDSVNSTGGFLAPEDFDAAIISVREQVGAFRQGAERPTRSDGQVRPRRVNGLTANFVAEGAAIPGSQFNTDAVETAQKKLAILGRASSELFEDSAADLGEFLTSEIGYAFAAKEDDCAFNGGGTSTYSGIRGLGTMLSGMKSSVAAASTHNAFTTIDTTDLGNLIGGVIGAALSGAAWYVSSAAYGQAFARIAAVGSGLVANLNPDGSDRSASGPSRRCRGMKRGRPRFPSGRGYFDRASASSASRKAPGGLPEAHGASIARGGLEKSDLAAALGAVP